MYLGYVILQLQVYLPWPLYANPSKFIHHGHTPHPLHLDTRLSMSFFCLSVSSKVQICLVI